MKPACSQATPPSPHRHFTNRNQPPLGPGLGTSEHWLTSPQRPVGVIISLPPLTDSTTSEDLRGSVAHLRSHGLLVAKLRFATSAVSLSQDTDSKVKSGLMGAGKPQGFPGGSVVKNLPSSAGDEGLIPGSGGSPREGNGKLLQYTCLGNPMEKGAWQATVHEVTKSRTQLSD